MADKATTTKGVPTDDDVRDAIDKLREVLIDSGRDPTTVDAQLHADLQRLGGQQATKSGGIGEAFALPHDVDPDTGQTRGA
jgi:hypothetical protein